MEIAGIYKIIIATILTIAVVISIVYLNSQKAERNSGADAITVTPRITDESAVEEAIPQTEITATPLKKLFSAKSKSEQYELAKEITTPDGFINTDGHPITIGEYIGKKVILVDFWTYSCINCQRTTPYLNAWYEKYKDDGFVIVGIHTPEFEFEKVYQNVLDATKKEGIKYPVILDNDFSTWAAYQNRFWPRKYLIDIDGYIVYDHIGEGAYEETERKIQSALKERTKVLGMADAVPGGVASPSKVTVVSGRVGSPESYFGSSRNEYLGNGARNTTGTQQLSTTATTYANLIYLDGIWNFTNEYVQSMSAGGKITYKYSAKNVYLVASAETPVEITILIDGKVSGRQIIKENVLYTIVEGADYGDHTLEIITDAPGLMAYAFTFG